MATSTNTSQFDTIVGAYDRLMAAADPRVENLLLMKSPIPVTSICLVYIYFVLSLGPRLMRDRKPFGLRGVLIVYNAAQTIFSAVHFYLAATHWAKTFGWGLQCYPIQYESAEQDDLWTIQLCHAYFLSKISELADTVFFVLKKKHRHVSLLHVFHHAAMPFSVWFGVKYNAGGNLAFFGLPNLFVHIWMYMYYMVAAMGPQYQKYIWWKRHITEMQLIQFGMVMFYMLYVSHTCNLNRSFVIWIFILDIAFVILFVDFYRKAYNRRKTVKETNMANGKMNGTANGTTNGMANGKTNGIANGVANGKANGTVNGTANGTTVPHETTNGEVVHQNGDALKKIQ